MRICGSRIPDPWIPAPVTRIPAACRACRFQPQGEMEIEVRQIFEAEDFGAEFTPELREQEERLRAEIAARR
jgi:hypothetical protein